MWNARPIYKKLLIAAIVIYITGVAFILCDIIAVQISKN